ncbi:MAG: hypothetical protein HY456_00380 [Parcubacteria group bacterium]|nr:hypothetical protein [Parcubacteria group bacterium]
MKKARKQLVRIDERRSDPSMVPKLEPFKPVMEKYARLWGKKIIVVAGNCSKPKRHRPRKLVNAVVLYFGAFPEEGRYGFGFGGNYLCTSRLFGINTPAKGARLLRVISDPGYFVVSPEQKQMAIVRPHNIYVLVDLFGRDWPGAEKVFEWILALALPRAILKKEMRQRIKVIRRMFRQAMYRSREEKKKSVVRFMAHRWHHHMKSSEEALSNAVKKLDEAEERKLEFQNEIEDLIEYHNNAIKYIADNKEIFGKEFEKLLLMEGVLRVAVDKTDALAVITDRIITSNGLDIGAFEIYIDPYHGNHHTSIEFHQQRYRGPYEHTYAKGSNVCFGNMNSAVDKLLVDGEVVNLVHLLLSFLRLETKTSYGNARQPDEQEDYRSFQAWSKPEPYPEDEKAADREAYMALRQEVMVRKHEEHVRTDIKSKQTELKQKEKEIGYWRGRRNHFAGFLERLRKRAGLNSERLSRQLDILLGKRKSPVIYTEADLDNLDIYLYYAAAPLLVRIPKNGPILAFTICGHRKISLWHRFNFSGNEDQELNDALIKQDVSGIVGAVIKFLKH